MEREFWALPLSVRTWRRAWAFVRGHWFMSIVLTFGGLAAGAYLPTYPDSWGTIWTGSVAIIGGALAAIAAVHLWMLLSEPFLRLTEVHELLVEERSEPPKLDRFISDAIETAEALDARVRGAATPEELDSARRDLSGWAASTRAALDYHEQGLGDAFVDPTALPRIGTMRQDELATLATRLKNALTALGPLTGANHRAASTTEPTDR